MRYVEKIDLSEDKTSTIYLEQIDGNNHEKMGGIIRHISAGVLPKINGETRVLEIGVGSGGGIKKIKDEIKDPKLVVYGIDILEPLARQVHRPEQNVLSLVGNLSSASFVEKSISAINLSSVLHEGISYDEAILSGALSIDDYLKKVFNSLLRTLEVGGLLAYRDPWVPHPRKEIKTIRYAESVGNFIEDFHRDFASFYSKIIKDVDPPNLLRENGEVVISGPVHYHTEVQRHLITYLDFALRETLGKTLKEILSENEEFEIGRRGLVDTVSQATTNQLAYDSWLKREGEELYTYRSLTELTELLEETSKEKDFGLEIIEAYETERVEYSNFLKKISDTNLRDSKQNLLIKRTR